MERIPQSIQAYLQEQRIFLHFETIEHAKSQFNYRFLQIISKQMKRADMLDTLYSIYQCRDFREKKTSTLFIEINR